MDAPRFKGPNVSLHVAAARLRPSAVAAADGDWDAVIARAKMQVASQKTPAPPAPPPPRRSWEEMPPTPPPVPTRQALGRVSGRANATLDAFMRRGRTNQSR